MKSIVTFKPQGRLGNYLFQAFTAMAYAWDHDLDFSMPDYTNNQKWNPIYFPELIHPQLNDESLTVRTIKEHTYFKYDPLPFCTAWKTGQYIHLDGYFQNPKYFEKYRSRIIDTLRLPQNTYVGIVGVHVRRGDYITITDKHVVQTKEWIERAMTLIPVPSDTTLKYEFYSDDIQWCRDNFNNRKDCFFSEGNSEFMDFLALSQCQHHINSSSTFSWMAAWLATGLPFSSFHRDTMTITPKEWMTPRHRNQWMEEDLIPKTWVKL